MTLLCRTFIFAVFLAALSQSASAYDLQRTVPITDCDLDSFAVKNVFNTYYVFDFHEGRVNDLILRGKSIKHNPHILERYLYNRGAYPRRIRSLVSAARKTWQAACPEKWDTAATTPSCVDGGSACICFNDGDIVDFTQCGESLIADCESIGCTWDQDPAGNVVCTCPVNE